ncbi:hypothetical protein KUCAC02_017041 [Chaenocephalus aceratus]|nr:hypothetical protein KUCAC02_017041 [Chaenocephalus aceratus]
MATLKKILFRTLEQLGKEDFEEFKWHLQQEVLGFEGIPKSRLEGASRTQTVDHMFLNYCINTIKVTRNVLKEINQNLLEEKLSKIPSEPTEKHHLHMVSGFRFPHGPESSVPGTGVYTPLGLRVQSMPVELLDHGGEQRLKPGLRKCKCGSVSFSLKTNMMEVIPGENMATLKKILFRTLEQLGKEDFEEFKWHLQQEVLGFEGIPKSRLEGASRTQTVDHMFLNYCINTIKVTRNVLKEINQNLLVEKLSEIPSEPTEKHHLHMVSGFRFPHGPESSVVRVNSL